MAAQLQLVKDRRSNPRYPVHVALEYRLLLPNSMVVTGVGTLVDMSSSGVLFQTAEFLPHGAAIELFMAWPTKLNNTDALHLYVTGTVVRTHGIYAGVEICASEFRIQETRAPKNGLPLPVLCHT